MHKKAIPGIMVFLFLFSLALFPPSAGADHVIKGKKHTDAFSMMGQSQPAKDEEVITWMAKDKMRKDEGNITTLLRFDINKIYLINHPEKTYSELALPLDLEKILPPEAKQMMETMEMSSNITDTGETKTIQ